MNFGAKALAISLTVAVPMAALVVWQFMTQFEQSMQARMNATRQHVEVAMATLEWAQSQEQAGTMTRKQAQQAALGEIARMRYDSSEYFWVNDMQPRMIMHPINPNLDGQDVSAMKDPNGLYLFQEFVRIVRSQGKGFVAYQWPKPGNTDPVDKVSYVQGFNAWGWVLGSGVYVGDIKQAQYRHLEVLAAVIALASFVAGYLFLCFYKVMDGGLKETTRHLRAITAGDLTTMPTPWGRDEAAQLMTELRQMQQSLQAMVVRVRRSSSEILNSSTEIASVSIDLSSRTESATANLEQSASSMEQISSTIKLTAERTEQASVEARRNAVAAGQGGEAMHRVVSTIDAIQKSSSRIGQIIGTIDSIAFQTNLLALNAAVEAARAGEQGRGFAVVATEVRRLAQRSAVAASEIRVLIGTSAKQIADGTSIVRDAGATIKDIIASSRRVDALLSDISTCAREQSLGLNLIGESVHELDQTTQQNAALVEQTAEAASSLKDQAITLTGEVERFRLPG